MLGGRLFHRFSTASRLAAEPGDTMTGLILNEEASPNVASRVHRGVGSMITSANLDGYPREDMDEDGEIAGRYLDPVEGATEALLGGISAPSGRMGEPNGVGVGIGSTNRRGYRSGDDRLLLKRVPLFVMGKVRTVNSYMKNLARQQQERERQISVREVELGGENSSSNPAGVGLPHSISVGHAMGTLGRSGAHDMRPVRMEAGSGAINDGTQLLGEISGGRGHAANMAGRGSSRNLRSGGGSQTRVVSINRGSRMTGETPRGLHRPRQEGGALSVGYGAEETNQGWSRTITTPGGVNWTQHSNGGDAQRANRGWLRSAEGLSRMTRRRSEGSNLARMERSVRSGMERSFRVLGLEIGHLSETQQFLVCAAGVFTFLLLYGYLQERLVLEIFKRKLGLFLTLLQFAGYATCAILQRMLHHPRERSTPLTYYVFLGLLQACMQALTNISMGYLSYPAKVLFKSSRVVPIMCFGVLWQGRKYTWKDYLVVFLIVSGLVIFMRAENSGNDSGAPSSLMGVGLISVALMVDAALINIQEEIMNKYDSCQDELVMFSYLSGTVFVASACLYTGDFMEGVRFIRRQGVRCVFVVMVFAGAGFMGVSFVAALTKRFGALVSAITTTVRKAITLLLSFVLFPANKHISMQHLIGAVLFISGLAIKSKKSSKNTGSRQQDSPAETPVARRDRSRRRVPSQESDHLDSSSALPLLTDEGSGGGSSGGGGAGPADGSGEDSDLNLARNSSPGADGDTAVLANTGGNPVRHRSNHPQTSLTGNGGAIAGTSSTSVSVARGVDIGMNGGQGYWQSRPSAAEGTQEVARSPRRRITPGSPSVSWV